MRAGRSGIRVLVAALVVGSSVGIGGTAAAEGAPHTDRLVYEWQGELHAVAADGSGDTVIAERVGERHHFGPDLSPDGTRVVATRCASMSDSDGCEIIDLAVDGTDVRVIGLPASAGQPRGVAWSPDGTRIAFTGTHQRTDGPPTGRILVVNRDGSGLRDLGEGGVLDWSPAGSLLVATVDDGDTRPRTFPHLNWSLVNLEVVHLDGRPSQRVRTVEAGVTDAAWSPDGRRIALTLDLPHSVGISQPDFVYVMNADGSGIRGVEDQQRGEPGARPPLGAGFSGIAWAPSSDALAVGGRIYDLAGRQVGAFADSAGAASWGQPAGAPQPCSAGYRLVGADGGVFAFGDAGFFGSMGGVRLDAPVVGMASTPTGDGYWLVAADGGVFSFGDAGFFGSMGDVRLDAPVVGVASTSTGDGYLLVASDGGVFTFGDARFHGSTGGRQHPAPVVAIRTHESGRGYWLVGSDGGVHPFGEAPLVGNADASRPEPGLGSPVVSATGAVLLATADGQVVPLGSSEYCGSRWNRPLARPIVGAAST